MVISMSTRWMRKRCFRQALSAGALLVIVGLAACDEENLFQVEIEENVPQSAIGDTVSAPVELEA